MPPAATEATRQNTNPSKHVDMPPGVLAQSLAVPLLFVVGVVAAVVATLVMDQVMPRLPEGETPPFVAAGVLTEHHPDDAPSRLASVVHYVAGWLTGPLFVWLLLATQGVLGTTETFVTVAAAVLLYVLMVGFFAIVVLPQSRVEDGRVGTIRRDWAIDAAAYVVVLVLLVAAGTTLV